MSVVTAERFNHHGVLLRYEVGTRGLHHDQLKFQPSDRLRIAALKAEAAVRILWIVVEHLELSDIGLSRITDALRQIEAALNLARDELGLETSADRELAGMAEGACLHRRVSLWPLKS